MLKAHAGLIIVIMFSIVAFVVFAIWDTRRWEGIRQRQVDCQSQGGTFMFDTWGEREMCFTRDSHIDL